MVFAVVGVVIVLFVIGTLLGTLVLKPMAASGPDSGMRRMRQ